MSRVQIYLRLLAEAIHDNQISEDGCVDLARALEGVPESYHDAAFYSFLGGERPKE